MSFAFVPFDAISRPDTALTGAERQCICVAREIGVAVGIFERHLCKRNCAPVLITLSSAHFGYCSRPRRRLAREEQRENLIGTFVVRYPRYDK